MPVTTKSVELEQDTQDSAFAKQLEAMLGGLPSHNANAAPQTIERNIAIDQVSIDEVLAQANDGISLAQIIDATMQQAGDLLAQLYYSIEDTAAAGPTNYIALNNSIRQQIDAIDTLFASVTFQDQAIFDTPSQRKVPTGLNKDDFVTLQIPNVSLNQLGAKSWQLADGPILPRRVDEQLVFRFNNLRLQDSQRVRLLIGEADVLQECMGDLNSTMATIAELINQAELDWLNQAIVDNGELSVNAPGVTTANLLVEAVSVATEDSLTALQVQSEEHTRAAMQVVIGAINMLADYRDVAVSVANDLHQAMNNLMTMPRGEEINAPLAKAMVKDVQNMFAQRPLQAVAAQTNIEG